MRADVAKATMLADCELRQDWREGRPKQKRGMEKVAVFLLEWPRKKEVDLWRSSLLGREAMCINDG